MDSLPRVRTPSQLASVWSPVSLPVGLSSTTLQALRDVFLVLDAAQGGHGVIDVSPLRRALEANDALLWWSDDSDSSCSSDDEADEADEGFIVDVDSPRARAPHRREGRHQHAAALLTSRAATYRVDLYGLIRWWLQHVGEDSGTSRAVSPTSTRSARVVASPTAAPPQTWASFVPTASPDGHGEAVSDSEPDGCFAEETRPAPEELRAASMWQPLRALSTRDINSVGRGRSGKILSLSSLRSPSPHPRNGTTTHTAERAVSQARAGAATAMKEPPASVACRSLTDSFASCASQRSCALQPLKPLGEPRGRSASDDASTRRTRRLTTAPTAVSITGSAASLVQTAPDVGALTVAAAPSGTSTGQGEHARSSWTRQQVEAARAFSCATAASTCGSSTTLMASRVAFFDRDGALWKATARAHAVLRDLVVQDRSSAALTDADVALIARAFDGFLCDVRAKKTRGVVGVEELTQVLTALLRTELGERSGDGGEDVSARLEKRRSRIQRTAEAMISRARETPHGSVGDNDRSAPPSSSLTLTRAQFIASFLCGRAAFPPQLLAFLLRLCTPTSASPPLPVDSTVNSPLWLPQAQPERVVARVPDTTPLNLKHAHKDDVYESSPFEVCLLVELVSRYRLRHRQAQHRANNIPASSPENQQSASAVADAMSDAVPLEDMLNEMRRSCLATAFDAAVPSDKRACDALLACLRDVATNSALCLLPTSVELHVDLPSLIAALTDVSAVHTTALPASMRMTPTRVRLERAFSMLAALHLPQTMLDRLVELIVSLDLHRPHNETNDTDGQATERSGDAPASRASGAAVRQLERLRRLRRAIPRTLGYIACTAHAHSHGVEEDNEDNKEAAQMNTRSSDAPVFFETSPVYACLTALARVIVATAAPRVVRFRHQAGDTHREVAEEQRGEEVVELSLTAFFQRLVSLVGYVPALDRAPHTALPPRAHCAEFALRSTICALGFTGARDVAALFLTALQFQTLTASHENGALTGSDGACASTSKHRFTVRAVLPRLFLDAETTEEISASMCALIAVHREDWSEAQCRGFFQQTFVPVFARSDESGAWTDVGALLTVWLSAIPAVRFPTSSAPSASLLCTHTHLVLPLPLPRYPLCEEVALFSPCTDVTSLYLSLRQITVDAAPRRDFTRADAPLFAPPSIASTSRPPVSHAESSSWIAHRAVQPIPFTHLHDFLVDAPRLFAVLRHLCWQDEVSADFVFLVHTLKAISLTPEGIYIKLHKLERAVAPRSSLTGHRHRRHSHQHHRDLQTHSTRSRKLTETALWPLDTDTTTAPRVPKHPHEQSDDDENNDGIVVEHNESIVLCAKAYSLAHPVTDVLAATFLFRELTTPDPFCCEDTCAPLSACAREVSLTDSLAWFDRLVARLDAHCHLGTMCWLHAHARLEERARWWHEFIHCLFDCFYSAAQTEGSCTLADRRLSLLEWNHGLLALGVRAAMGEERVGMLRSAPDMRPSLFIQCLLQHTKVTV